MTPELIAAIIAVLGALGAFLKSRTDMSGLKEERAQTAQKRDQDSLELHDSVQKNSWEITRLKEDISFVRSGLDDHQMQLFVLNTELAKVSTKLDSALDILRDLKEAK